MRFAIVHLIQLRCQLVCIRNVLEWRCLLQSTRAYVLILSTRHNKVLGGAVCNGSFGSGGETLFLTGFTCAAEDAGDDLYAAETAKVSIENTYKCVS
jgi:hypothetical protein